MIHFDHGAHTRAEVEVRDLPRRRRPHDTGAPRDRHREHGVVRRLPSRARGVDRLRHLSSLRKRMVERRTFLKGSALAAGVALLEACGDEVQYLVQPLERPEGRPGEGRVEAVGVRAVRRRLRHHWCAWSTATRARSKGCARTRSTTAGCARWVRPRSRPTTIPTASPRRWCGAEPGGDGRREGRMAAPIEARRSKPVEWDAALAAAAEAIARAAPATRRRSCSSTAAATRSSHAMLARLARAIGAPAPIAARVAAGEVERRAAQIALGFDTARRLRPAARRLHSLDRSRLPRSRARSRRGRPGR